MNQKQFKNILFLFFWGARPGSASGCLKKATQIPKAGHPISNECVSDSTFGTSST
jgi:hypothetical protein